MIIIKVGVPDMSEIDANSATVWLEKSGIHELFTSLPYDKMELRFVQIRSFVPAGRALLAVPVQSVSFSMSACAHGDERRTGNEIRRILMSKYGDRFENGCRHFGCGI